LMGDVAEEAIIRPRATVVPVTSTSLDLPLWDVTTAQTKGVASFWGGMQMQWTGESTTSTGTTLPESESQMRQLTLKMWELGGTLIVSAPLMQDARGLE